MSVDTPRPTADEAIDDLDHDVSVGNVFHAVYAFFYNKTVGVILILIAGLLCLFGVLFPQMPAGVKDDPARHEAWLDTVRPAYGGWTNILDTLGIFNMFSSVAFIIVMGLLAASILACTFHRLPLLKRAAFEPRTRVGSSFYKRARERDSFVTAMPVDDAAEIITEKLTAKRLRVIRDPGGEGINLYVDKNHLMPFGTVIAHIAFVVIMFGFVISPLTGFRDSQFALTVGYPREVGHDTGLVVEAVSFQDSYYENGAPKDYVADLVLYDEAGNQLARQDIRVNEPLKYDGIMFHQAFFGVSAVINVKDSSGASVFSGGVPLEWTVDSQGLTYGVLPIEGHEIYVIAPQSGVTTTDIASGDMRVEVYEADSNTPIAAQTLQQGQTLTSEVFDVTFEREQQYTGLIIKKDHGTYVVWAGSIMLIVGTIMTMGLRHHRMWLRVRDVDGQTTVEMASQDRHDVLFAREFYETADMLSQAVGGTDKDD